MPKRCHKYQIVVAAHKIMRQATIGLNNKRIFVEIFIQTCFHKKTILANCTEKSPNNISKVILVLMMTSASNSWRKITDKLVIKLEKLKIEDLLDRSMKKTS